MTSNWDAPGAIGQSSLGLMSHTRGTRLLSAAVFAFSPQLSGLLAPFLYWLDSAPA